MKVIRIFLKKKNIKDRKKARERYQTFTEEEKEKGINITWNRK